MHKGIINVKTKPSKSYTQFEKGGITYYEMSNTNAEIEAYIDKDCLSREMLDSKQFPTVHWIVVEEIVWDRVLAEYNKENKLNTTHGNAETLEKIQPHILYSFTGNAIQFNLGIISGDLTAGNVYLLMPFSKFPEKDIPRKYLRLVYVKAPHIRYAYIQPPSMNEADIPPGYDSKLHLYGMNAKLNISNHLLPDFRKQLEDNSKTCTVRGEVFFVNEGNEEVIVDSFTETIDATSYNSYKEFNVFINPEWRDMGTHEKPNQSQKYYIKLHAYITNRDFSVAQNPDSDNPYDFNSRLKEMLVSGTYNTYTDFQQWRKFNAEKDQWEDLPMQPFIEVRFDTMEMIYRRMEIEKSNMIQYIGDIEYTEQEYNPCAFSVITVNVDNNDYEIFNEFKLTKKVDDKTNRSVDIVCGDEETKAVKVTAKFLKDKNAKPEHIRTAKNGHMCEMILNNGKKHNGLEDVFKMGWIIGQWVPSHDPQVWMKNLLKKVNPGGTPYYHPSNALSAPVLDSVKILPDQDAKGTPAPKSEQKKYEAITVAQVQRFTDADYSLDEASDSITLNLKYNYNKSYSNEIARYLLKEQDFLSGGILNDNVKNLWVVRYLLSWVKGEPLEQTYFVPVTTCRYPNQIAQIRVFPDMKWVLNFNYNIDTPIYYKASTALETYYSGYNEGTIRDADGNERPIVTANSTRRGEIIDSNITNMLQRNTGRLTSFGLSVECEVSGQDDVINIGKDFAEKYRQMLSPFLWMVNELDSRLAVSSAREEANNIRTGRNSGLLARLNKLPMSFELKPPSLGVGLGIGYTSSKSGSITYELDGRIKANPIIGAEVKLDILALGSKFKPWGAIIDALDIASWAANVLSGGHIELDYKIEVRFSAEIKLTGKQTGTNSETGEKEFASEASLKYNLADKKLDFEGGIQGEILGEIEISADIRVMAKKGVQPRPISNKYKVAEFGIGAKASSYVKIVCPFELNDKGNLDVDFFFSGVKLEIWLKATVSSREKDDDEPNIVDPIPLVPKFDLTKTIEF
ncbi:hypothetical protein [Chryseobacterium sp.]|uniref:hypothetical protein n=1 Tax=Chryseobacterium sp. TaxID=1871047 RepID=UPI00289B51A9|nr:hypothetical protein [Chryseobacterium sp.]